MKNDVNFEALKGFLLRYVRLRIRNGYYTERHLARLIGTSQPQLHNVLKGARPLKQGLADALLKHFQIGLLDLLRECEPAAFEKGLFTEQRYDVTPGAERALLAAIEPSLNTRKAAAFEEQLPGHKLLAS